MIAAEEWRIRLVCDRWVRDCPPGSTGPGCGGWLWDHPPWTLDASPPVSREGLTACKRGSELVRAFPPPVRPEVLVTRGLPLAGGGGPEPPTPGRPLSDVLLDQLEERVVRALGQAHVVFAGDCQSNGVLRRRGPRSHPPPDIAMPPSPMDLLLHAHGLQAVRVRVPSGGLGPGVSLDTLVLFESAFDSGPSDATVPALLAAARDDVVVWRPAGDCTELVWGLRGVPSDQRVPRRLVLHMPGPCRISADQPRSLRQLFLQVLQRHVRLERLYLYVPKAQAVAVPLQDVHDDATVDEGLLGRLTLGTEYAQSQDAVHS